MIASPMWASSSLPFTEISILRRPWAIDIKAAEYSARRFTTDTYTTRHTINATITKPIIEITDSDHCARLNVEVSSSTAFFVLKLESSISWFTVVFSSENSFNVFCINSSDFLVFSYCSKEISNTTWRFCNSWRSWDICSERVGSSTAFTRRTMILWFASNSVWIWWIRSTLVTVWVSSIWLSILNARRCNSWRRSDRSRSTSTSASKAW